MASRIVWLACVLTLGLVPAPRLLAVPSPADRAESSTMMLSLGPMGLYRWAQRGQQLGILTQANWEGTFLFADLAHHDPSIRRQFGLSATASGWGLGQLIHFDWTALGEDQHHWGWRGELLATWSTARHPNSRMSLATQFELGVGMGSEHHWDVLDGLTYLYEVILTPSLIVGGDLHLHQDAWGLRFSLDFRVFPWVPYGLEFLSSDLVEWQSGGAADLSAAIELSFPLVDPFFHFVSLSSRAVIRMLYGDADLGVIVTWGGADVVIRYGVTWYLQDGGRL